MLDEERMSVLSEILKSLKASGISLSEESATKKTIYKINSIELMRYNLDIQNELDFLEIGVLEGLLEGRTRHELDVAIKLNNPGDSFQKARSRILKKLNAFNTPMAIRNAFNAGIISI